LDWEEQQEDKSEIKNTTKKYQKTNLKWGKFNDYLDESSNMAGIKNEDEGSCGELEANFHSHNQ
jgi:hypothetical protein